jgi:hypothetical protein
MSQHNIAIVTAAEDNGRPLIYCSKSFSHSDELKGDRRNNRIAAS